MKKLNYYSIIVLFFPILIFLGFQQPKDERYYEMRTYYAHPGKIEDLQRRFREHTTRIFEKHGMTNVGYWVPLENLDNKIIYILSYPSKESREASWKSFSSDPEWQKARNLSEVNGKLVEKVESIFMKATDFSPTIQFDSTQKSRIFELRVYKSPKGKLNDLLSRFRNHTMNLFEKHGMTNVGYWVPVEKNQGSENTLIYILAHKSKEEGLASFKNFGQDPDWKEVQTTSEAKGQIVEKIESIYMAPTDYSPIK